MNRTMLLLAASMFITGAFLTGCKSNSEKVMDAEEEVIEANQALDDANEAYLTDIEKYRLETAAKIEANNKSIAEFNARTEKEKLQAKADYKQKIADLEKKNSDLKMRMEGYEASGKENWEQFKIEFNRDMEELGNAMNDLLVKNTK